MILVLMIRPQIILAKKRLKSVRAGSLSSVYFLWVKLLRSITKRTPRSFRIPGSRRGLGYSLPHDCFQVFSDPYMH
jgi:hypothetical protein